MRALILGPILLAIFGLGVPLAHAQAQFSPPVRECLGPQDHAWGTSRYAEPSLFSTEIEASLYANFWWDGPDGDTWLEITANSTLPITVMPIVHIEGRKQIPLPAITMGPLETHRIHLADHLPRPEKAIWGTVTLEGETNGIAGWIISGSVRSGKTSESIFRRSVEAKDVLLGHWWRQSRDQQVWFVLQNVSQENQSVQVAISNQEGTASGPLLNLGAQEAVRVSLRQLALSLESVGSSDVGTVRFTVVSGAEVLLGQILLDHPSSSLLMGTDLTYPSRHGSIRLDMAGGPAGRPGPEWGFPEDATFSTRVVVANLSERALSIESKVYGHDNGQQLIEVLNEGFVLGPGETRLLPASGGAPGIEPFQSMSLEHSGDPGDLSAIGYTVQANGKTGFACPFVAHGKGAYLKPVVSFDLSRESTTLLLLRNVSDQPVSAQYAVSYIDEAGNPVQYSPVDLNLAPDDFKVVNLKHLRDQRVPDRNGSVLPLQLTRGSAFVASSRAGALLVADPTVNQKNGNVHLCTLYCDSEAYYAEGGGSVLCNLLVKTAPIVRFAGARTYTLVGFTHDSGLFDCFYTHCPHPSPICNPGSFALRDRGFCAPGVSGVLTYVDIDWFLFTWRQCFVNGIVDLPARPC